MSSEARSRYAGKIKNLYWLVFVLFLTAEIYPQWVQTNGPYGGYVHTFAVSGTNLFAGTNDGWGSGGLFLSSNNGTSWNEVMNGLAWEGISAIAVSSGAAGDTNIFVGVGRGVWRSTNNGTSWTEAGSGLTGGWVTSFAVSGTNLFTGLYYGGVFLSTDNGTSWTPVNEGIPKDQYGRPPSINALALCGQNLVAGVGEVGGVFLSTNNGASWTQTGNTSVWCFAVSGTNLFAGTYDGVFLSTNNGTSWTEAGSGLTGGWVTSFAVSGTNIFAGTLGGGVFLSTNNGTSWTPIGLTNKDVRALAVSPNGKGGTNVFAGTVGGVFLSTNHGTSWTEVNNGLTNIYVYSLAVSPAVGGTGGTNLFAGTSFNGVFLSTDNGMSWTAANSGLTDTYALALAVGPDGTDIFAGTYPGGVFLSTNNGTSWAEVNAGLPKDAGFTCFTVSGTNLFAGSYYGGVFLSTNNGTSWTAANEGLPKDNYGNYSIMALAVNGVNLFAGYGNGEGIFLSTNNGASWAELNAGLNGAGVNAIVVSGTNIFAGTGVGLFLSTDNGTSWTAIKEGLPRATYDTTQCVAIDCLASTGQNLFAGTYGDGVFLFTNNGATWSAVNSGLTDVFVRSLAVSGTNLFTGTEGRGIWRRPLSEMITAVESSSELPTDFILEQNYPNPFNPSTIIKYSIKTESPLLRGARGVLVTLKVYDILGREVETLVDEEKLAGTYEINWNAKSFSSGVYYYQLIAGDFTATKKLLLLK